MTTTHSVTDMTANDIVEDLRHIIDGSTVTVDGITAGADIHPAHDPAAAAPGYGAMLVDFTDAQGRRRVAEVTVAAKWLEDSCWHATTIQGQFGPECTDCGTPTGSGAEPASPQ